MKSGPVHLLYATCVSALVLAIIGVIAWAVREPWLFPSLGPTIFLQVATPNAPGARVWNTLVGHAIGVAAGIGAVILCAAGAQPAGMSASGPELARVAATAIAVGASTGIQIMISAEHPPAAATTMLISLGALPADWTTVGTISAGVCLCAALGEIGRRISPARTTAGGRRERERREEITP